MQFNSIFHTPPWSTFTELHNNDVLKSLESSLHKSKADTLIALEDLFGDRIDYCRSLVNIFCRCLTSEVTLEIRMFAGQVLRLLIDKKYIRMSERDVESFDTIKERLMQTFLDSEPAVRKLC